MNLIHCSGCDAQAIKTHFIGSSIDHDIMVGKGQQGRLVKIRPGAASEAIRAYLVSILQRVGAIGIRIKMHQHLIRGKEFDQINNRCRGVRAGDA